MRNQNKLGSLIFLSILGVVFLIGDFILIKDTISFLNNSEKAEGTVVRIIRRSSSDGSTYSPEVTFVDKEGKTAIFISDVSSSNSGYSVGEKVPVLYDKSNSEIAKINKFLQLWGAQIGLGFMGAVLIFFSLLEIISRNSKSKLKTRLLVEGVKISAKVISIDNNFDAFENEKSKFSSVNLNEKTFQVVAQWLNPADNKIYIFKSDFMDYNPENIILNKDIFVYIDPSDPNKYYIDLSSLPEIGN